MEAGIIQNYVVDKFLLFLYYLRMVYIYIINLYSKLHNKYFNESVVFVKNKQVIRIGKNNINSIKPDFCAITYNNENLNMIKITDDFDLIDGNIPEKCMFSFIFVSIENNDKKYDITSFLNNNISTYYLNNSVLFDKNFMTWLSIKHLKHPIDNVKINIIDHNVNQFTLSDKQFLKLGINNYHIDQIKE
tara:strand:- start:67 stop:633 length:567 start_codon:yes stop_codon:yes gene_type:complete